MSTQTESTGRLRSVVALCIAFLAMVALVVVPAAPASAVPSLLTVDKRVDGLELQDQLIPGDEFTYTVAVACFDSNCIDAQLRDTVPAAFDGFDITGLSADPMAAPTTFVQEGCVTDGNGIPIQVTADCTLGIDFVQDFGDGTIGLAAALTVTLSVALRVPFDLSPDWEFNGQAIVNTGEVSWANGLDDNPATATDDASVVITAPVQIDLSATKTWTPASQQFLPGDESTITIGATGDSNVLADTLVLQDPSVADPGAAELAADNPFRIVDFAGFGATSLPANATTVTVSAYVFDGTGWQWVDGEPSGTPTLPDGVAPGDVGGIRLTYAGDGAAIAADATVSVPFTVVQRADDRNDGTSLVGGASVSNEVVATLNVPNQDPTEAVAQAPFAIGPLTIDVTAAKEIDPGEVPAGQPSTATISATNASNGPVDELTMADVGFLDADMVFGGFAGGLDWPTGASAATITWYIDGVAQAPVPFADGEDPVPPAGVVTGFAFAYTGAIPAGAAAVVAFDFTPSVALVSEDAPTATRENTVDVSATNIVGTETDAASDDITVFYPEIVLQLQKNLTPATPVTPGGTVVAALTATTGTGTAQVDPTQIVIEDTWRQGQDDDFWNGFDLVGIAPTQVPPGTTLTVEFQANGSATWQTLTVVAPSPDPALLSLSQAQLNALLAPLDSSEVTGLRFTFDNPDGYPKGTTVAPNVVYEARDQLRDGTGPTSVPDGPPSAYENEARAQAEGSVAGIPDGITSDLVTADDTAQIQSFGGGGDGPGTLRTAKRWVQTASPTTDLNTISSQSGDPATTALGWFVSTPGYSSMQVTDSASDLDNPEDTVFQAFDLVRVRPITTTQDPLLQWDDVTAVELRIAGAWQVVPAPGGTWMGPSGFVGYTLTAGESAAATGVRLTYAPDDAARAASADPLRPEPGSGIASSSVNQYRPVLLDWTLRNVVRVPGFGTNDPWVTALHGFNDPDPATVWNTVLGEAAYDGGVQDWTQQDNLTLIDQPPAVSILKTVSPGTMVVPAAEDVAPENYPEGRFRLRADNQSTARASYIRVTDPLPCAAGQGDQCVSAPDAWDADPFAGHAYDPATNPYERLSIIELEFDDLNTDEVDPDASTVTLWHWSTGGVMSTTTVTVTQAQALSEAALADVVGVSVVYQGTSPETDGGSIGDVDPMILLIHYRVRQTERSDPGQVVEPGTIDNVAQTQSYDPVMFPSGQASTPNDEDDARIQLIAGVLDVTAAKTLDPTSVLILDIADTPVGVTLEATSGDATAPTQRVTIEDSDADFWNAVRLADDPALSVTLPDGADQVRVDALVGGSWVEGTFGPTAALPAVDPATVVGLRFVFSNAAGVIFSDTAPPADWEATATFDVQVLAVGRDGIELDAPSELDNTVTTLSERTDGLFDPADAAADATLQIDPGIRSLDVVKSQPGTSHIVAVGAMLPWTLQFTNTGTGVITVDQLTDELPEFLEWDFGAPDFETSAGGTLGTDVEVTADASGRVLTFVWPETARQMQPGEQFTITLNIALLPGVPLDGYTENAFIVSTGDPLDGCTNTSGNGEGVIAGVAENECGTTNYVQPPPGGALFATKYVKGEVDGDLVDGEVNPNDPGAPCPHDAEGFTRLPCAAYSAVGGTDEWKLSVINTGTIPYTSLTFVDPLPRVGDRMLATGAPRNSTYQPVYVGADGVTVDSPGTPAVTVEVTTTVGACYGTGGPSPWPGDTLCNTTATWVPEGTFAGDWADVTALRVTLDYTASPGGTLPTGGRVGLRYHTVNQPATAADPALAPVDVPVSGDFAWNQTGVTATLPQGPPLTASPVQAGVTLLGGDLTAQKQITGDIERAPDEFFFGVGCTVAGAPVTLPDDGALAIRADADFEASIVGIPLGAECVVSETGALGTYGEASREGDGQTIVISSISGEEPVVATIVNDFAFPPPPPPINPDEPLPGTGMTLRGVLFALGVGASAIALGVLLVVSGRRRRV